MPTPGEQKALLFLGAVALLGGGVRLFGGEVAAEASVEERAALARQIAAADSARAARAAGKGKGKKPPAAGKTKAPRSRRPSPGSPPATPLDVDRASMEELETLPGIGPALAARIVADRNAKGPFGGMEALDGVSGIGPTLINRLGPYVTFSGPRRPLTADRSGGGARGSGRVVGLIGGRP